ncbi:MAG: hypothetical protein RIQ52_851 [Pseudomonadota bacterium]|jgi:predicted esterase YcpF (UPF0227 family)
MIINVLYLHGWHSVPGGTKPTWLEQQGITIIQPALPSDDFEATIAIGNQALLENDIDVIVGSSRGGAAAMNLDYGQIPLVLLCPAWKRWGSATTVPARTLILHAEEDEVIPYPESLELLAHSGLTPEDHLITTGHDHRLADAGSLRHLLQAIRTSVS